MTENLFGGLAKKDDDGTFDAWDPRNIANVVTFLAAPQSADINGQIFVVFGGNIYAMSAFQPVGQVARERGLDSGGTDRRQGRPLQGYRLRRAEIQFLLITAACAIRRRGDATLHDVPDMRVITPAKFSTRRSPLGNFTECPHCGGELRPGMRISVATHAGGATPAAIESMRVMCT